MQNVQPVSNQSDTGLMESGQASIGLTNPRGCGRRKVYDITGGVWEK